MCKKEIEQNKNYGYHKYYVHEDISDGTSPLVKITKKDLNKIKEKYKDVHVRVIGYDEQLKPNGHIACNSDKNYDVCNDKLSMYMICGGTGNSLTPKCCGVRLI